MSKWKDAWRGQQRKAPEEDKRRADAAPLSVYESLEALAKAGYPQWKTHILGSFVDEWHKPHDIFRGLDMGKGADSTIITGLAPRRGGKTIDMPITKLTAEESVRHMEEQRARAERMDQDRRLLDHMNGLLRDQSRFFQDELRKLQAQIDAAPKYTGAIRHAQEQADRSEWMHEEDLLEDGYRGFPKPKERIVF